MTNSPTNSVPSTTTRVNYFTGLARRRRKLSLLPANGDGSTLSLDFTTGVLDQRLTFTRTTNATFINSQGLVEWAQANLMTQSNAFTTSPWVSTNVTMTTDGESPVGSAWRMTENSALASVHRLDPSVVTCSNGVISISVYVKQGSGTRQAYFLVSDNATGEVRSKRLNPVDGSLQGTESTGGSWASASTSVVNVGGGWYRLVLTATKGGGSGVIVRMGMSDSGGNLGYNGDGTSYLLFSGMQINPGSVQSYVATSGSIYQAPRFDYDPSTLQPRGLLIEGSSVNYVLRSDVTGFPSPWSTAGTNLPTVTAGYTGGGFSPDGITYPTRLQFGVNAGGSASRILQATTYATNPTTANPYTVSVWMKSNTAGTNYTVNIYGTTGNNLVTVTPTWQRFQVVNTSGTSLVGYIYISNESTSIAADVSIWGAQLEAGSGASSYIPTGASTGSRTLDHCYATGANFTSWFSTGAGTVVAVSDNTKNNTQNLTANISDGTTNNYVRMGFKVGGASNEYLLTTVGGPAAFQGAADSGYAPALNTVYKMAYAWDTNNFAIVANGGAVATDTSGTLAGAGVLTQLVIGGDFVASPLDIYFKNGHIRSLKYYPTRLPNAQLQALTT